MLSFLTVIEFAQPAAGQGFYFIRVAMQSVAQVGADGLEVRKIETIFKTQHSWHVYRGKPVQQQHVCAMPQTQLLDHPSQGAVHQFHRHCVVEPWQWSSLACRVRLRLGSSFHGRQEMETVILS